MVLLLPRLSPVAAERLIDDFLRKQDGARDQFDSNSMPDAVRFGSTGGSRATPNQLKQLHDGVTRLAITCGLGRANAVSDLATFDALTSELLADSQMFASGEALRDDVWACIATVVLPHVVHWRFGESHERYLGGVRNTFQRLWLRGRVLDRGKYSIERWGLLKILTEDAFVQIIERPSVGGDPKLALPIAEAWVRAAGRYGKTRMEPIMRRATLTLRIQNEIRYLAFLSPDQLDTVLDHIFDLAAEFVNKLEVREPNNAQLAPSAIPAADSLARNGTDASLRSSPETETSQSRQRKSKWAIWRAR